MIVSGAPAGVILQRGYGPPPSPTLGPGQANQQAWPYRPQEDTGHPMPQADGPLANVVQKGGQQHLLVLAALPSERVEDVQAVALISRCHGVEQPPLLPAETSADNAPLLRTQASPQRGEQLAYPVGRSSQRHQCRSPSATE